MLQERLKSGNSRPSLSEQRSWEHSLPVLAEDLQAAGLDGIEVLLEYRLPLTSQRVDVILAGSHPRTGEPSMVLVELKQWSEAQVFEEDPHLLTVPGVPHPRLHPSRQVAGYQDYLRSYLTRLHDHESWVRAVAYVHGVMNEQSAMELSRGADEIPVFTGTSRQELRAHLAEHLAPDLESRAASLLQESPVAPSTKLMQVAAEEIRERERFTLLGNQQLAADMITHEIERAGQGSSKRVIVVQGGPGSGKSAIALSALGELARDGRSVLHATGSRSFTQTMRKIAGHRSRQTQSLFKYFNSFAQAEADGIDVLIADEAHRIRETSNNRFTKAANRSDRLQIDELVSAAKVPVFLLDDRQVVRHGELGSTFDIANFARMQGFEATVIELGEQFRCGGSAAYVEWVEQILGLSGADPAEAALPVGDPFEVLVVDSPWELERLLKKKQSNGFTSRMTAGFCWPWSDPNSDGLVDDVVLGDWARPWNNKSDRRIGTAPPSALWATEEGGFDQVGCIYTAQGFEFDWAGVILGPDILWRDGHFETVRSANKDPQFRNASQVPDARFDLLIRHVYKVLLTRGMIGTVIYSPDEQTRDALRQLLT
nr:DUF2075 domain-containing protein [Corynebacterium glaucum]